MPKIFFYSLLWLFTAPPSWHYNLDEAKKIAHKEHRQILDDTTFLQMADTSLVLVNANFTCTLLLKADGKVLKTWDGNPGVKPEIFAREVQTIIDADK